MKLTKEQMQRAAPGFVCTEIVTRALVRELVGYRLLIMEHGNQYVVQVQKKLVVNDKIKYRLIGSSVPLASIRAATRWIEETLQMKLR